MSNTSGILVLLASIGMTALPSAIADVPDEDARSSAAAPDVTRIGALPAEDAVPDEDRAVGEQASPGLAVDVMTDAPTVPVNDLAIRRYEDQVARLEQHGGAYDPDLAETLLGLGLARMAQHDYPGAEAALQRALHTTRVNYGLYSAEQVPILERLVEINTTTRDYQELNSNYHLLFWLSTRIYGADDPRVLPEIDRMGRWHLAAYAAEADGAPMSHLFAADELYGRAVQITEKNYGPNDPRMINALYGLVVTKYQIAAQVSRIEIGHDILMAVSDNLDERSSRVYSDGRYRERLMIESFRSGKETMDRIASIPEGNDLLPPESYALAQLHLGDWNVLFDKWNAAQEAYSEAYTLLSQEGLPREVIDRLFEQPRSLPAIGLPEELLQAFLSGGAAPPDEEIAVRTGIDDWYPQNTPAFREGETQAVPYVLLEFDVSRSGKASNISVVEAATEDASLSRKAIKSIAAGRFRPRIQNGEPVDASGVRIRMVFKD
ncbi:MAG: energy transducer TonB [Xanthomonadales bacterium]|nr:energy transducer TonB [Xanthomonadales bacterium]